MVANRSIAVVAEGQNFYNVSLTAMLQREVGFAKVMLVQDYAGLNELVSLDFPIDFLAFDFDLPGASGLASIRDLCDKQPGMRVAVFSACTDLHEILSILAAGAHGFIPKQTGTCGELLQALEAVEDAGIFVPSSLLEPHWSVENEEFDCAALAGLTGRQQQVIKLLSEGHANKVIARRLGISPSTVKVHVHAAFRTLGVHSRIAAMAALRHSHRMPVDA